jgi:hypothetical protein
MHRSNGNQSPSTADNSLTTISAFLLDKALSPTSHTTYNRAYKLYEQFSKEHFKQSAVFPVPVSHLLLFIAHCYKRGLAPATVCTYISAIGYKHKILQMPDPTASFLVKKSLQGYNNDKKQIDGRLPITTDVLQKLLHSLRFTNSSYFHRSLLKAMYLVAFHAFLRIGEITVSNKNSENNLSITDVKFIYSNSKLQGFELYMTTYKHYHGAAKVLFIKQNGSLICPVSALNEYLQLRKASNGPLFGFMDGSPVSRLFFSTQLRLSLNWAGLDPTKYKGHSFRIGAASTAAQQGFSEEKIKLMGRWSSSAFKKYIRIPMLQV